MLYKRRKNTTTYVYIKRYSGPLSYKFQNSSQIILTLLPRISIVFLSSMASLKFEPQ